MKVWMMSFLLVFGSVEFFNWLEPVQLPLPLILVGGMGLAIASNYGKHFSWAITRKPTPPTSNPQPPVLTQPPTPISQPPTSNPQPPALSGPSVLHTPPSLPPLGTRPTTPQR